MITVVSSSCNCLLHKQLRVSGAECDVSFSKRPLHFLTKDIEDSTQITDNTESLTAH